MHSYTQTDDSIDLSNQRLLTAAATSVRDTVYRSVARTTGLLSVQGNKHFLKFTRSGSRNTVPSIYGNFMYHTFFVGNQVNQFLATAD